MGHPKSAAGQASHERWNEAMALRYDPDAFITKTGLILRWMQRLRLKRTRAALGCRPTDAVLDVGCGAGNLLEGLAAARVVGLDLSDFLLEKARARTRALRRVEIVKGDAESLPFPAASFDRVACSEVLEHVRDPARVLSEIHRVAKPGARVVLTLPNERLINLSKRLILALGLKRLVAGAYPMSDDMLNQWHLREVEASHVVGLAAGKFRLEGRSSVPLPGLAYHHIFILTALK